LSGLQQGAELGQPPLWLYLLILMSLEYIFVAKQLKDTLVDWAIQETQTSATASRTESALKKLMQLR